MTKFKYGLVFCLFVCLFFDSVSLCWPRTHYADQASFELTEMDQPLIPACWDCRHASSGLNEFQVWFKLQCNES